MDFAEAIRAILQRLERSGLHYALIGGLALAMRGVQRATFDLDLLLLLEDLPAADKALEEAGYRRVLRTTNVSHYEHPDSLLDRIDLLHAFRTPTREMLERAERLPFSPDGSLGIPVLTVEDLIGLKLQALTNDPSRALPDWNDIYRLLQHAAQSGIPFDWARVRTYLELFALAPKLAELQDLYDAHKPAR